MGLRDLGISGISGTWELGILEFESLSLRDLLFKNWVSRDFFNLRLLNLELRAFRDLGIKD